VFPRLWAVIGANSPLMGDAQQFPVQYRMARPSRNSAHSGRGNILTVTGGTINSRNKYILFTKTIVVVHTVERENKSWYTGTTSSSAFGVISTKGTRDVIQNNCLCRPTGN
jgi:hypothetical protein